MNGYEMYVRLVVFFDQLWFRLNDIYTSLNIDFLNKTKLEINRTKHFFISILT
jgi:hypothetical protein